MPVDKFRRMSDTKTKDTGVSLTYNILLLSIIIFVVMVVLL